jgi:hypothetical protein
MMLHRAAPLMVRMLAAAVAPPDEVELFLHPHKVAAETARVKPANSTLVIFIAPDSPC